ncbi:hypothetical protein [Paenibacillus dendritiformis]
MTRTAAESNYFLPPGVLSLLSRAGAAYKDDCRADLVPKKRRGRAR